MRLAVIPARGGSKRVPGKNVRRFAGRPMLAWSVKAALEAGVFDRIVVSTEDEAIADTARAAGAEVPFRRPPELADDHTPTQPVIAHAIAALGAAPQDRVCCIYATAPFLRPEDLRRGDAALTAGIAYTFAVTSFGFPIQRALRRDAAGRVAMIAPEHALTRSQDLEDAWHDAGQFYWAAAATWAAAGPIFGPASIGLPLPRHRVQDIDTEEDWRRAELMHAALTASEA